MSSKTDTEDDKDNLLANFLKAVKACQIRFGGRTELATEETPCIVNLCQVIEDILEHGLHTYIHSRGIRTIQHMKNLVSSSFNFQTVVGTAETDRPVVWWFIRELLTQHEYHRFLLLKNVVTDIGRSRAWIRSLLNEHSLERYIHIILSEEQILNMWFEPWALLRNQEKACMLPNLAAGLDTILFAINIDNEALNYGNKKTNTVVSKEVDVDDTVSKEACIAILAKSNSQVSDEIVKKRKKKVTPHVVSFEDDYPTNVIQHRKNHFPDRLEDKICNSPTVSSVEEIYPHEKFGSSAQQNKSNYDKELDSVFGCDANNSLIMHQVDGHVKQVEGDNPRNGVESLKHVSGSEFDLIPLSPNGEVNNFYCSSDSMSLKSYQDYNESEKTNSEKNINRRDDTASTGPTTPFSSLTFEELRLAVLEISRSRDSAEERRNEISDLLSKEVECVAILKAQASHDKVTNVSLIDRLSTKVKSLTRENELLRHQLKKYVSAVQMLRRDESGTDEVTSEEIVLSKNGPDLRDYHDEALAYESKLIQVAEMHGELMEFNERLQKLLRIRESQVIHFREELVELRGPFPQQQAEEVYDDAISIGSDLDAVPVHRTLINVWIPTAFMSGPPTDTHHVYQIYIRIKEDEWNVYRRFAQFYELHNSCKKKFAMVKTFYFPKKKTFGYKDIGVVEDRRIRLQAYLRKLINFLLTEYPYMATQPSKESLIEKLPFLIDHPNGKIRNAQQSSIFSRLSSTRNDQTLPSSPQYNGL